jgi:hypothetical protein
MGGTEARDVTQEMGQAAAPITGDPPPVPAVLWCTDCRVDPITGLVAFPDFHAEFPRLLGKAVAEKVCVGIAIGDVDDLKAYVEDDRNDPFSFGHLAGFALMTRLGEEATRWFWDNPPAAGCVSTFGGDEIIVTIAVDGSSTFLDLVHSLQDRLNAVLPRTVSFAATVVEPHMSLTTPQEQDFYLGVMTTIDRKLFNRKRSRRLVDGVRASFTVLADLDIGGNSSAVPG